MNNSQVGASEDTESPRNQESIIAGDEYSKLYAKVIEDHLDPTEEIHYTHHSFFEENNTQTVVTSAEKDILVHGQKEYDKYVFF